MTTNGWRGPGWRVFDGRPGQAKTVRDWIGRVVASHDCPVDPDDTELVVTELFSNALLHGPSGGRVLVGYCLWPAAPGSWSAMPAAPPVPRLRDPAAFGPGRPGAARRGRDLGAMDCFRIGQAQVVWCDLGQPLQGAAGDQWAWLAWLLAEVPLAPLGTGTAAACRPPASAARPGDHLALRMTAGALR